MTTKAFLGKLTYNVNELGEKAKIKTFSSDFIYAEWKSVKQTEFYQAMMNGLKPELVISINKFEYYDYMTGSIKEYCKVLHPVTQVVEDYTIIRTYEVDSDNIELTLSKGIA